MIQLGILAAILATWAACLVALVGIGSLIRSFTDDRPLTTDDVFDSLWVGLAFTVAFLQIWHCFLPIDWRATIVVAIGMAGVAARWRPLLAIGRSAVRRRPRLAGVLVLLGIWLANRATGPAEMGDSGNYHVAGIRWASEYAIVPGLGNLLDLLSLNNTIFLCHALVDTGFWWGRSNHLVNPFLIAVLMTQAVIAWARCVRPENEVQPADVFLATVLPLATAMAVGGEASSPGTDLGASIAGVVSLWTLIRLAQWQPPQARPEALLFTLASTTALAITLKLSLVVVAGLAMLSATLLMAYRQGAGRMPLLRTVALIAIPWCVLLVPWAARGIVLSGYPAFPSTALSAPVAWRLSEECLRNQQTYMRVSGFFWWIYVDPLHHPVMNMGPWIATWLWKGLIREPLSIAVPIAVACVLLAVRITRSRPPQDTAPTAARLSAVGLVITAMPIMGGLAFWAINSPAPRFGAGILWMLAGWAAVVAAGHVAVPERFRHRFATVICMLCLAAIGHRTAVWARFQSGNTSSAHINPWIRSVWMPAGPDRGLHPYPTVELVHKQSKWGVVVNMPAESTQTWWAPLPATFNDITNLRLRQDADMAKGFVTAVGDSASDTIDAPTNVVE